MLVNIKLLDSIRFMDKRKNNGNKGHSTKAKGLDKRKNEYKTALDNAATVQDVEEVIKEVLKQAKRGELQACKLFLEYYLGKPKQQTDITTNGENINALPPSIKFVDTSEDDD